MGRTVLCVSKPSPAHVTRNLILERAGYRVISVDGPEEAMHIVASFPVDAVVFGDSMLPKQRIELAHALKNLERSVPIVVLNNPGGTQFAPGMVDEQLGPLGDPHLLLEALTRVLDHDGHKLRDGHPHVDGRRQSSDGNGPASDGNNG
ncbi:MAG TPA: response regulator [Candidatus Angelobacter sp.]|nr:response regulator [Candidatus Angelobacter sp.]